MAHAKTLARASHAREKFLCLNCAILYCVRAQTIVAVATIIIGERLAKVTKQNTSAADGTIGIGKHLIKLLVRNTLFLLVLFLCNDALDLVAIAIIEEKYALCRQSIAASTARFLIVALQRLRQVVVNDGAYVWLADTHTKCNCCNKHRRIVTNKALLVLTALFTAQASMIG